MDTTVTALQPSASHSTGEYALHRASWVVPVSRPPIPNGAVLAAGNRILLGGPYGEVKRESPSEATEWDHGDAALIPGLVNGHCHLELSAMQGRMVLPKAGFPQWLSDLLALRGCLDSAQLQEGFHSGLKYLQSGGVALCGDITGGFLPNAACDGDFPERQVFWELIGFNLLSLSDALDGGGFGSLSSIRDEWWVSLAAHACYSTSAPVIVEAKEWCRKTNRVFTIHTAEHTEEMEFLRDGTGYCRALLETLGKWAPCWAPPRATPVDYLDRLGVLDARTLLVHAVHMKEDDWKTVAASKAAVCFCPRSNRNMGVGKADIPSALRHGVTACIGTDSLASNGNLNLLAEGVQVLNDHPSVRPETVLQMLTLNGAKALGRERDYGTLEPGRRAAIAAIPLPGVVPPWELAEAILHGGNGEVIQWCRRPAKN